MLENSRDVRGDVVFAVTQTDDQRAVLADGDQLIRMIRAQNAECIRTADAADDTDQGVDHVALVVVIKQLCDDLGVGLRTEDHAGRLQLLLERDVVFNNAVVNDADPSAHAGVRVGVDVVRRTVGRPAGVSDAERAVQMGNRVHLGAQVGQTSLRLDRTDLVAEDGDSGRVIAAVFQLAQAVQKEGGSRTLSGKAYNSTHNSIPPEFQIRARLRSLLSVRLSGRFVGRLRPCAAAGKHPPKDSITSASSAGSARQLWRLIPAVWG